MEMQLGITEGKTSPRGFSCDITVRIATEMGGQPSVIEKDGKTVTTSEMGTAPSHADESERLFVVLW